MYQNMRHVIEKGNKMQADSIHFLRIPDYDEKLINHGIQKVFEDTMEIIVTGRALRDNKKKSLKQPVTSLTIIHRSEDRLNALKPVVKYIED